MNVTPEACSAAVRGPGPAPGWPLLSWYTRGDNPAMSALLRRSPENDAGDGKTDGGMTLSVIVILRNKSNYKIANND